MMWKIKSFLLSLLITIIFFIGDVNSEKIIYGIKKISPPIQDNNSVFHKCVLGHTSNKLFTKFNISKPWSLPQKGLADATDTINVLVLRYNFQFEDIDDPGTTGRGVMDLSPFDSIALIESVGHIIDPPPHNSNYFNSHMRALKE
jgi:hypothetical protein